MLQRETINPSDPYAVATLHDTVVVGHMLQIISAACLAFIRDVASCEERNWC